VEKTLIKSRAAHEFTLFARITVGKARMKSVNILTDTAHDVMVKMLSLALKKKSEAEEKFLERIKNYEMMKSRVRG
jgi:hypothetical protein